MGDILNPDFALGDRWTSFLDASTTTPNALLRLPKA